MLRKTFVHRGPLHSGTDSISFSLYSSEDIKKMSVVKVITPVGFNSLGHPLYNGLYDPRLGPYNNFGQCGTCQQSLLLCPGHFGHIELPLPVINPLFLKTLLTIFRLSCLACHSVTIKGNAKEIAISQLNLLQRGLMQEAQEVQSAWSDEMKGKVDERIEEYDKGMNDDGDDLELGDVFKGTGTRNVENVRRQILREIFKNFARMDKKCGNCGTPCKMMLYDSKLVYTLKAGAKSNTDYQDEIPIDEEEEDANGHIKTARGIISSFTSGKAGMQKYLTPLEARDHLRLVWVKEKDFLSALFPVLGMSDDPSPTDLLFVETVPVPPPKNRPAQMLNNQMVEHPQNMALRNVVSSAAMMIHTLQAMKKGLESLSPEAIRAVNTLSGQTLNAKLESVWNELQVDVDRIMDRDKGKQNRAAVGQLMGLKQMIEKKEGLFRMHMMGKRVNHAARTVITPDPNIHVEEIGIPDIFAKTLTIPVQVTPFNVQHLRRLVMNGPNVHPGAVYVENEVGQLCRLDGKNETQRAGQAKRLLVPDQINLGRTFSGVKTVYRHLQDGDYLLLNRQPSLHRPSIMAHRARVLHGEKVFRLHYANCKHYNADFDGDEMNAHFPQSLLARAEAASVVNVCSNFLVPKDGTPLAGLIQDHIVAAVKLTVRGRFFNYADYQQLVYFALCSTTKPIITLPPAIMKPVWLWSGKQVVSTIIMNLVPVGSFPPTFYSAAKIKPDEWKRTKEVKFEADPGLATHMSESFVVFRRGTLVSGVLDKVQLGATQYGLCHAFFELYGNRAVGDLLSAFSKLMTNFLQWEGFTLGIKDVLVLRGADVERRKFMKEAAAVGPAAAAAGAGLQEHEIEDKKLLTEKLEAVHRSPDPKSRAIVDAAYKQHLDQHTNNINRACLPYGLVSIFPENNLQLLVQSGAKGSTVNTMQMSCLLGQIELEGKRPHLTISGHSLPSFKRYDVTPRAGGFIAGRFLTGIRPQEFFFHCMAGREGLIDTAVKTSRSGYLQRCIVKLLEGVVTQYDGTVRDSDGSVIQFRYGEDGLDVGASQYLKPKTLDFLHINSHIIARSDALARLESFGSQDKIAKEKERIQTWKALHGVGVDGTGGGRKVRNSPALVYFRSKDVIKDVLRLGLQIPDDKRTPGRTLDADKAMFAWRRLQQNHKRMKRMELTNAIGRCPDPLLSYMAPESNFGVISEALQAQLEQASKGKEKDEHEDLKRVAYYKAMRALSTPGDAVGVLAAQSIGEPSTQMTLNTFHFAGRGEMNVTLGIPRLREILMVASENIRTPSMDIPFKPNVSSKEAERLRLRLGRVTLENVLQYVEVKETVDSGFRIYKLKFQFLQYKDYAHQFCVRPPMVLKYFEKYFIKRLCKAVRITAHMDKGTGIGSISRAKGRGKGAGGEEGDETKEGEEPGENLYEEMEKQGMGEDHESSDEEAEQEDVDATQATRKKRQTEAEYEPEEEPEEEAEEDELDPDLAAAILAEKRRKGKKRKLDDEEEDLNTEEMEEGDGGKTGKDDKDENEEEDEEVDERLYTVSFDSYDARLATVCTVDGLVHDYDFDRLAEEHCTLTLRLSLITERVNFSTLLKEVADKAVIHQVQNIKRAFIVENGDKRVLKTEGINILAMTDFDKLLNLNALHCNNIHTMAQQFGIEAAARVIVREMTDVFKAYGITIDPRHLTLIADYMAFSGTYRPFSRIGIESSPSPLHQMSFETVMNFLRDAVLGGRKDHLRNPSARLVVGKPAQGGTGLFQLMNNLSI